MCDLERQKRIAEEVRIAIETSVATVLKQRGLADDGLSRECGRNAAQTVMFTIEEE